MARLSRRLERKAGPLAVPYRIRSLWIVLARLLCLIPLEAFSREPDRGEQVMKALGAAYPDRIERVEFRDRDWAVLVQGRWFYYAQGRLLPEELRNQAEAYDPLPFYHYPAELPPWEEPDAEAAERFQAYSRRRQANPPRRSHHFYDALWQAGSQEEAYRRVKSMRFLNRSVLVHYSIMEELALVEARLVEEAKTDAQIREWIGNINTAAAWNWRNVAQTASRSFHAYGTALDLLPAQPRTYHTYWLWTMERRPQWWTVPYAERLHPPSGVIKAFEAYGFIWGGKWLFFDTMHFEYRPEILLLNNLLARP